MTNRELVAESNRIEGIHREPTHREIVVFEAILDLDEITVTALENFVNVCQPGAKLRDKSGMNVKVGNHFSPQGCPEIRKKLEELIGRCNFFWRNRLDASNAAYQAHIEYEKLHPFMDGNGRSGRMLWYWMMRKQDIAHELGFLHTFYYQALGHSREEGA